MMPQLLAVIQQGKINENDKYSPTLCQKFAATAFKKARELCPLAFIVHYTDSILLSTKNTKILKNLLTTIKI